MVLTSVEWNDAKESRKRKCQTLFRLRQSTNSFIVQCLADREIQKISSDTRGSKAYQFNCTAIHRPELFHQFSSEKGPGWDSANEQTENPELRWSQVVARFKKSGIAIIGQNKRFLEESRNLEETIAILRDENKALKKKYADLVRVDVESQLKLVQLGNSKVSLENQVVLKQWQLQRCENEKHALRVVVERLEREKQQANTNTADAWSDTEIEALLDRIHQLQKENQEKSNRLVQMEKQKENLGEQLERSKAEVFQLKQEKAVLESKIYRLQTSGQVAIDMGLTGERRKRDCCGLFDNCAIM